MPAAELRRDRYSIRYTLDAFEKGESSSSELVDHCDAATGHASVETLDEDKPYLYGVITVDVTV